MPGVARLTDSNTTGGVVSSGTADTVLVNGLPCAVVGSVISPHAPWGIPHPPHIAPTITAGNDTVIVEGKPIAIQGSPNSCGHSIITSSEDVIS